MGKTQRGGLKNRGVDWGTTIIAVKSSDQTQRECSYQWGLCISGQQGLFLSQAT